MRLINRKQIWLAAIVVTLLTVAAGIAGQGLSGCMQACAAAFHTARRACDAGPRAQREECREVAREAFEGCKEACH